MDETTLMQKKLENEPNYQQSRANNPHLKNLSNELRTACVSGSPTRQRVGVDMRADHALTR
jgi:hypothetical protein